MRGAGRMERYVAARVLAGVGAALAVISAVILLVEFVDLSRGVGVKADVSVGQIFWLTLLRAPSLIQVLLPFVFLFGGIGAFVGLNRRSELVAMRAAGVSAWRFILPSALGAFIIGIGAVTILNPIASSLNSKFELARASLMQNYLGDIPEDIWLRQGDEHTQIVIHAKARDAVQGYVRLRGVSLFIYTKAPNGAPLFRQRIEASEARLMQGYWQLRDVREATAGENSIHSDTMAIRSSLDAESAMERLTSPEAISFWRLPEAIRLTEQAGFSAAGYRLRLFQLLSTPLLYAAMSILAAAFSLRLARLGGLAGLAGAGVALGFVLFFFNQFAGALAKASIIPLFAAAWAPALVALLSGLSLLFFTEDG
ncbi:MAG: LPS export ABC transporter permease LptG [Phenylobacterium sp.]|nr:MAG: LPS export ABC transporter permease LptG [Phenylobacterium sp.]